MTWDLVLRLAVVRVGLTPDQFWGLTFTEFQMLVDNYYHKQDLQTIQTREIMAMLYNVNRGKGASKSGKDLMATFEEEEKAQKEKSTELPTESTIDIIKKKYGGAKGGL